jgi:hypothetical protein
MRNGYVFIQQKAIPIGENYKEELIKLINN